MRPKTIHLSRGLALMVTEKAKYLCWQPSNCDRAAHEMWLAHTEGRLRQKISERLATKGD